MEVFETGDGWLVWDEATDMVGYGDTRAEAISDYRDSVHELFDYVSLLGDEKVAPRLWAMLPALRQALGIAGPL